MEFRQLRSFVEVVRQGSCTQAAQVRHVAAGKPLTPRERDVLRLLVARRTDREIADALFISPRTVNWHVAAILTKLGADTRRDAAALALANGLV